MALACKCIIFAPIFSVLSLHEREISVTNFFLKKWKKKSFLAYTLSVQKVGFQKLYFLFDLWILAFGGGWIKPNRSNGICKNRYFSFVQIDWFYDTFAETKFPILRDWSNIILNKFSFSKKLLSKVYS